MRSRLVCASLLLVCLILPACGEREPEQGTSFGPPVVYTTFYPTTYFAQRLAGDLVEVVCPVPPDADAIFWKPATEIISKYQAADLIIVNGAGFEKWVETCSLPLARIVDTAKPLQADLVRFESGVTHTHGPAGAHAHEGIDGHTWLDPQNAKVQAGEIASALKKLLPGQVATIDQNAVALAADLDSLDREYQSLVSRYEGELILASHPAYNYLKKRYGLNLVSLDLDPEAMPDAEVIAALAEAQEKSPARYILWESAPTSEIKDRFLSELGLTSVVFSPCELMDAETIEAGEDYLTVMRRNIQDLVPVLTPEN